MRLLLIAHWLACLTYLFEDESGNFPVGSWAYTYGFREMGVGREYCICLWKVLYLGALRRQSARRMQPPLALPSLRPTY